MPEPTYKRLERVGERLYDEMDEPGSHHGLLSEIKECFEGAISDAEAQGLGKEMERLRARLNHIAAVYRQQFDSGPPAVSSSSRAHTGELRKQKMTQADFSAFTAPLVGMTVSHLWRGAGSALFLEFGPLSPRPGEFHSNCPEGEMTLMVEWSWRIEGRRAILAGSWSKESKWPRALRLLRGATVADISLCGRLPEIRLRLANGAELLSFNTSQGDPKWTLFRRFPDGKRWISVRAGALYLECEGS